MSAPIIVGLDGSARGEDALALGRMLARTCDAPVLLAAIASGPRPSRGGASSAVERAGERSPASPSRGRGSSATPPPPGASRGWPSATPERSS